MTVAVLGGGAAVVCAGVFAWHRRGRRARLGEVGLVPWNSLMLLGMIVAVFAAAHLLTLWRGG